MDTRLVVEFALAALAVLGGAGGYVAWRRLREVEGPMTAATIRKTDVETRKLELEVMQSALKTVAEQRTLDATELVELRRHLSEATTTASTAVRDVADLRRDFERAAARVRAHIPYDEHLLKIARQVDPSIPDPPPLVDPIPPPPPAAPPRQPSDPY